MSLFKELWLQLTDGASYDDLKNDSTLNSTLTRSIPTSTYSGLLTKIDSELSSLSVGTLVSFFEPPQMTCWKKLLLAQVLAIAPHPLLLAQVLAVSPHENLRSS